MAARPDKESSGQNRTYLAAGAITKGRAVYISAEGVVTQAGAGAAAIGIAKYTVANANDTITVALDGNIEPVIVGTGGATAGLLAVCAADGLTNAPTLGAGTVLRNIVGRFQQTGVAGDVVGLLVEPAAAVSA